MFASGMDFPAPPQSFQTYLLPTLSFRRCKASTETVQSTGSNSSDLPWAEDGSLSASPQSPTSPMGPYTPSSASSSSYDAAWPAHSPHGSVNSFNFSTSPPKHETIKRPSYLSGATSHISCNRCHADLALTSQIISKGFTGRHGRAYLVAASPCPLSSTPSTPGSSSLASTIVGSLPNTHTHKAQPRHLVTGLHTVCDISCAHCKSILGWKYIGAEEESQRYKVGKFILETRRVTVGCCWENDGLSEGEDGAADDGDGKGWKYDLESRRLSNAKRDSRRRSSSTGYGLGLGMGFGLGLGFGSSAGPLDKPTGSQEEDDDDSEIMFDSQDEDECEDLFAGIWSPQLARRRRSRRLGSGS